MHTEMTLNIIVPIGSILFNFIDLREKSESYQTQVKLLLGDDNYKELQSLLKSSLPSKEWEWEQIC